VTGICRRTRPGRATGHGPSAQRSELADAVDGVPLYLERAIKDDHSALFVSKLGCVTLDGETDLLGLANEFKDFNPADMTTFSIPVVDSISCG
jgi:hypothetical protein